MTRWAIQKKSGRHVTYYTAMMHDDGRLNPRPWDGTATFTRRAEARTMIGLMRRAGVDTRGYDAVSVEQRIVARCA